MSQHVFSLDQAFARFVGQIKRRHFKQRSNFKQEWYVFQSYNVFQMKSQTFVIHKQSRFVNSDVCTNSAISEFRVYALPHANVGRLNIARETLTQYQTELDARQLTKDILSKKIDNIVAARMQRNYNRIESRRFFYKSN